MPTRSQSHSIRNPAYESGQRFYCAMCGSEIEIVNPSTCRPPVQVFRCCGRDMRPEVGVSVNLEDGGME